MRHLLPCRPVDNSKPVEASGKLSHIPQTSKVSLSLHNSAYLKSSARGFFFLFNKKSYLHLSLNLTFSNRKHHRCAGLACALPASPRLLLALASAGSRSRRLFASRPEPHYFETSISTPRVPSHVSLDANRCYAKRLGFHLVNQADNHIAFISLWSAARSLRLPVNRPLSGTLKIH